MPSKAMMAGPAEGLAQAQPLPSWVAMVAGKGTFLVPTREV
jgi:hypothetical protein